MLPAAARRPGPDGGAEWLATGCSGSWQRWLMAMGLGRRCSCARPARRSSVWTGPGSQIALDLREQNKNNVLSSFQPGEAVMFRAVVEEAAALASISLFIGMIAVWVQVFSSI